MTEAELLMKNIRNTRRKIRLLKEQIERDEILAAGVSAIRYDKDKVQTSAVGDRMTVIVGKIIDATAKLQEEIYMLQLQEEEAIGYLVNLKEEHERILTYHYLDGMDWKDVADLMGYTYNYIYELKQQALAELNEVLKKS